MDVLDDTLQPVVLFMLCICAKLHIPVKTGRGKPLELRSVMVELAIEPRTVQA